MVSQIVSGPGPDEPPTHYWTIEAPAGLSPAQARTIRDLLPEAMAAGKEVLVIDGVTLRRVPLELDPRAMLRAALATDEGVAALAEVVEQLALEARDRVLAGNYRAMSYAEYAVAIAASLKEDQ